MARFVGVLMAATMACFFSGCEDPTATGIQVEGEVVRDDLYTATVTVEHDVFNDGTNKLTAKIWDTFTRTDGGHWDQVGGARLTFTRSTDNYEFVGTAAIENVGGNNRRISASLGWRF